MWPNKREFLIDLCAGATLSSLSILAEIPAFSFEWWVFIIFGVICFNTFFRDKL